MKLKMKWKNVKKRITNDENLRFKTCFYEIDSCVMNSYNSFRQKLIFDTNDRKKKLKCELKVTNVHFAKNKKEKWSKIRTNFDEKQKTVEVC